MLASHTAFEEVHVHTPLLARVQPIMQKGYDERNQYLLAQSSTSPKKELHSILAQELPKRFILAMLAELDIRPHIRL